MKLDMQKVRADFPILNQHVNGKPLVYLDSGATSQRPASVLAAVDTYYKTIAANPHRGVYAMAEASTEVYENGRARVAAFVGGAKPQEIIFTRNTTESLNLLAYSFAPTVLQKGDAIVIPVSEHHSNLVPWQRAVKAAGAELRYLYPNDTGTITDAEIEQKITPGVKIVAFAEVSNVLGCRLPVEKLVARAKEVGAYTVLDCAQSVPHFALNLPASGVDFAAFSGHKMYAPMGIGVLYGRAELLEAMPPFLSGGDMIEYVAEQDTTYAPLPQKFEAGTQNVGGVVGLTAAIDYMDNLGWDVIEPHEAVLMHHALAGMAKLPYIKVQGNPDPAAPRYGALSFMVEGVHPHDVASILDSEGIAVRAGHHCAQPLVHYLGLNATCRASFGIYNTLEEVDALLAALPKVRKVMGYGD